MNSLRIYSPERASDVDRWVKGEVQGTTVKEKAARAVWRLDFGTPGLYVKRFPPSLFRDRAKQEAAMLEILQGAGIPCPRLVATAKDAAGSYVVTEEIPDAVPLRELLEKGGKENRSRCVALGHLVRRLHDLGFDHLDLHVGNILSQDERLFVSDVHRARKVASMSRERRLEATAFVVMSISGLVTRTNVARFLRACGMPARKDWADIARRHQRLHHRYYLGRERRCVEGGTGFGAGHGMYFREGTDLGAILGWIHSKKKIPVKVESNRGMYRSNDGLFLKETRRGMAVRIWRNAHGLDLRRISTPRLQACGPAWVVGEWVDAPDLHWFVKRQFGSFDRARRDDFLRRLARMIRRLHDHGVRHRDLKGGNILVRETEFYLIDLDSIRFTLEISEKDRIFNLAQLNASVTPPLTKTDRLRFLAYYFAHSGALWKKRPDWIRKIMKATVARRHRWPVDFLGPDRAP